MDDQPSAATLYLDLLKRSLTDIIYIDHPMSMVVPYRPHGRKELAIHILSWPARFAVNILGLSLVRPMHQTFFNRPVYSKNQFHKFRTGGLDQPPRAHTMVGLKRLDNLQLCLETVLRENIPGDFLETGVWRGGASIFAKGVLAAHGDTERRVWLADSFRGLPPPDAERFPADRGSLFHTIPELAISRETVQNNFIANGLLDERVLFLEGWFKNTLPTAPINRLAVLRLDGDLYESTIQVLDAMYDKVSPGGFIIIDDYGLACCRTAVADFRKARSIADPIVDIDDLGAFWRKTG